ncbi:udp-n-acetylglucosamine diphosphorylase, partial [Ochromonadaceae sp. CCMP2298]
MGSPKEREIKIDLKDVRTWPLFLQDNLSILNYEEKSLVKDLLSLGQQHLFATWDPPGNNDAMKHQFFDQIKELNNSYRGGISCYVKNAKVLLKSAKMGENPLAGWTPTVPTGVKLEPVTQAYSEYERRGIPQLGKCGFVLVAGGLGERLGFNGIKVALPSQTVTGSCYLELYCQQILYTQKRYASGMLLPLAIMVSDDTLVKTQMLLEASNYFGLEKSQVTLMKQGKVPALLSNSAHIALATSYVLEAKPHGHGDVHSLMHTTGTALKWQEMGVKYVVFFQDTNGLAFYSLPAMLGVSEKMNLEVNSLAVTRAAKQAVGALTKLVHEDGREMTVNVEYNQLDPLLRATVSPQGDVNDPATGCSPFPGNINQLLFQMDPYVRTLQESEGIMPEFVNPKYTDASKNLFKKPTRLECMMQDYPKLLKAGARVGFTSMPDWICYSPCKNNSADAAASVAAGIPAASPYTAECDQYFVFAELLRRMGAKIGIPAPLTVLGITARAAPRIVLHPGFAMYAHEIEEKFPNPERVVLTANSTLVVEGGVVVQSLYLDGSLKVTAAHGSAIIVR